ncbi:MAG: bifunctional DNA-formamidopyrimidine glycosylase/DNA-(apurinic or apyrimidinic site) lyase [candidate division WWE3 bacterium]|nr:bifunctional DNA-formamidopyrimidine glycosylase/DNA-(apurinic or apyrimidinic site) lyase [candidate division WWE3 bacterium]
MPELPEVETVRADLNKELAGQTVKGIKVDKPNLIKGSHLDFIKELTGAKFTGVRRQAKLLIFDLTKDGRDFHVVAHLKMTGRFLLREQSDQPDNYQHITIDIGGGKELRFCDLRQFGYLAITSKEDLAKILAGYGPEPLKDLTVEKFEEALKRKLAIKKLLLDQAVFSGIGNIYANEALFEAKIQPERLANTLSIKEASDLFQAISKVITSGLTNRGTTTKDDSFKDIYNRAGSNAKYLRVYERTGQPCLNNCGDKIKKIMVGGRGTYFCPSCQPQL